jgi:hypothetical protein
VYGVLHAACLHNSDATAMGSTPLLVAIWST